MKVKPQYSDTFVPENVSVGFMRFPGYRVQILNIVEFRSRPFSDSEISGLTGSGLSIHMYITIKVITIFG